MPSQYKYQAVTESGFVRTGIVNAQTSQQVEDFLAAQSLMPVKITPVRRARSGSLLAMFQGNDFERLISFTNQMATLHRSGIPLLRALTLIRIPSPGDRFNYVIEQIRSAVQSGKLLSEAMAQHPDLFNSVYVAGVMAGEESGKLEQTLDELSAMLEQEMEISRHLKTATRYPLIVVGVIILAITVVMTFVIPKFVAFYGAFNADLPLATRILIGASEAVVRFWPVALGGLIAFVLGARYFLSRPRGREWFDRQLLRLPVLGDLIIKSNVARFSLIFRILFRSGVPLVKSIDLLASTVKNAAIVAEVRRMQDLFRKGQDLSARIGQFVYFPEMALQLMAVGLESGSLDKMLEEVGLHYSREVQYRARHLTSILEPLLTLVLGAFVLLLALAIFLPMWNLIKVFRG
ncbi:hypothetical protein C3F09_00365 [candidate division GN15 bacterium]|uniref:Type II secretion system protein GspF domain-containing protein n=1 Tax=candidate division GN15 bacterium TaxID=2072418 RepID=A0A855XDG3_9BACT|nr:MAG: hypothetical protein C3F09_00365 [candidate division GN15 bacterium]